MRSDPPDPSIPKASPLFVLPERRPGCRRLLLGLLATAAVVLLAMLAARLAGARSVAAFLGVVLFLVCLPLSLVGAHALWRKLSYRVGVRLFLSYLLIGGVPFPILALLLTMIGWLLIGQYSSVRYGAMTEQTLDDLGRLAETAAAPGVDTSGWVQRLEAGRRQGHRSLARIGYLVWEDGAILARSERLAAGVQIPAPVRADWLQPSWRGTIVAGPQAFLGAISRSGPRHVVVLLPLDSQTATQWAAGQWFDLAFSEQVEPASPNVTIKLDRSRRPEEGQETVQLQGREIEDTAWGRGRPSPPGFWHARFVVWFRLSEPPLDWTSGEITRNRRPVALLRTSPADAWEDFSSSPYRIASEVVYGLFFTAAVFAGLYLLAVAMAALQIVAVARATAQLGRGARAVASGDLAYRIPVRRHDQLGDLALAFNAMTAAVGQMLVGIAERERLKREMELAREIQQSLLPNAVVDHAGFRVDAHFRPAAEVGGDFFDVFRLPEQRLVVAVGDIAGHGLSTGLLMAMVKSAMATLIQEGHRGVALLERLNRILLEQPVRHRMATAVLAELNAGSGVLEISSCGHPPAFVLRPGQAPEELEMASLPIGSTLPIEPAFGRFPFPPGSVLVLYTDGLIEATDPAGAMLGYDGLRAVLEADSKAPARQVQAAILRALDRHLQGQAAGDDLTVLTVSFNPIRNPEVARG